MGFKARDESSRFFAGKKIISNFVLHKKPKPRLYREILKI